ncbi:hypothetical protein GCM10017788_26690 [Amycolatopsis acidiphila]|nr:hypothetical protein GCM10017788_26690 [Amycolatopsis acidiphila]
MACGPVRVAEPEAVQARVARRRPPRPVIVAKVLDAGQQIATAIKDLIQFAKQGGGTRLSIG